MQLITVIPIQRGIGRENLTYFTSSQVELGSMVKVPLRKKTIDALVVLIEDARTKKAELKSADFMLRKVDTLVSKPFLSPAFMTMVQDTARFHAATTGAVLNVLLPKKILATGVVFSQGHPLTAAPFQKNTPARSETSCIISGSLPQRLETYRIEISKNPKTVIMVPTKELQSVFKKMLIGAKVLLPSSLIEIPLDTERIIIEDEGSNSYKGIARPFLDFRYAIRRYAEILGVDIVIGNASLNTHTEKIAEEHIKGDAKIFNSYGKTMQKDVFGLKKNKGHLFILGTRKGHSGTVVCQDCSHAVMCPKCNSPFTLHMKKDQEEFNTLTCHHCGRKESALTKCQKCGGWRLRAFGLGIEKIEEDTCFFLKKNGIDAEVARIDSTLKLTPKKLREVVRKHFDAPSSILIGTELILPYLREASLEGRKNDSSFIASLDTLLSLPDFCINDKIWRLMTLLDETTQGKVVIQAKNTDYPVLKSWSANDEKGFLEREMKERKAFNYPPYGTLIKISVKGKKEQVAKEMKQIETILSAWKPAVFPAFIKSINGQHILHALIILPKGAWVDEELLGTLRTLPLYAAVDVNPRSLL